MEEKRNDLIPRIGGFNLKITFTILMQISCD